MSVSIKEYEIIVDNFRLINEDDEGIRLSKGESIFVKDWTDVYYGTDEYSEDGYQTFKQLDIDPEFLKINESIFTEKT